MYVCGDTPLTRVVSVGLSDASPAVDVGQMPAAWSPSFVGQHPDAMPGISVGRLSFLTRKVWNQILSRGAWGTCPDIAGFQCCRFFQILLPQVDTVIKLFRDLGPFNVFSPLNPFSVVRVSYLLFPSLLYLCLSVFPSHPTLLRLCQNIEQGMECEDMRSCAILGIY